ncbi:MAG TPA: YCF48-related protein, partial [Candidatus Kapabacteria bacterium]|nr:YCF48-related protein [Candidatus Kapabacteria bacterium]
TDGGKSWFELTKFFEHKSINYYNFFDKNTGIFSVVQPSGEYDITTLYKTTNGGEDWFELYKFDNAYSRNFFFLNEQIGWNVYYATSKEFYIYKTTDGGNYWFYQKYLNDSTVYTINFENENFGYCISSNKKAIYITNNGGVDWKTIKLDSNLTITNFSLLDENNILVGSKGGILKTADGGETWNRIQLDSNETYTVINFINDSTCWALGRSGLPLTFKTYYKTTNQGESWEKKFDSTNFNGLKFFDELNGYVYSSSLGSVFKTTDGGDSWVNCNTGTNQSLTFYFTNKENGWAIGDSGILLNYSCTETAIEEPLPISENNVFQIFPNPATNEITLSIPEEQNLNSISIFNSLGMEVKRIEQSEIVGKNKITILTADLPSGLYHCSFVNQGRRVTKSFVVVR